MGRVLFSKHFGPVRLSVGKRFIVKNCEKIWLHEAFAKTSDAIPCKYVFVYGEMYKKQLQHSKPIFCQP